MQLRKYDISKVSSPYKADVMSLYNARADEVERMEKALKECTDGATADALRSSLQSIYDEANKIRSWLESWDEPAEQQLESGLRGVDFFAMTEMRSKTFTNGSEKNMVNIPENMEKEARSLQRFLSVGANGMTEEEKRGLNIAGAAAVLPTTIYNELITNEKYSDLLQRAKVFNERGAGKLNIPIASNTAAAWHTELAAGAEASPALSKIELGGFELMRLMSMSAAAESMTTAGFLDTLLQLLGAEVVETLEYSFINGSGENQPKGLVNLAWNEANTVRGSLDNGAISFKDIASAISKLPQKYARNCILLMNADTAYNTIAAAEDSVGKPIFNMSEATQIVLGREVVISEHMPANTIFVIDPRELYVRFSMPVQVEADRSSGFTSATTHLRALCVVDAAWNAAACVKIAAGAA